MSDYISKSLLLKMLSEIKRLNLEVPLSPKDLGNPEINCFGEGQEETFETIISKVKNISTVDAVPVVRCGECEYFDPSDNQCYRPRYTEDGICDAEPNGGCTYGRRKGGEK